MRNSMKALVGVALALAATACNSADKGSLSISDKLALVNAVSNNNSFQDMGVAAPFAPIALTLLGSSGPLTASVFHGSSHLTAFDITGTAAATYDGAVGMQVIFNVNTSSADTGSFTGVLGWTGLSGNTVQELVSVGSLISGSVTPPSNGLETPIGSGASSPSRAGFARYTNNTTNPASQYNGTSGTFTMTSATFPDGQGVDCSQTYSGHTVTCSYKQGTMTGSFTFGADRTAGTGPTPYSQTTVHFTDLPTIRIVISVAS